MTPAERDRLHAHGRDLARRDIAEGRTVYVTPHGTPELYAKVAPLLREMLDDPQQRRAGEAA